MTGKDLRMKRINLGVKRDYLAACVGVCMSTLNHIETGITPMHKPHSQKYLHVLEDIENGVIAVPDDARYNLPVMLANKRRYEPKLSDDEVLALREWRLKLNLSQMNVARALGVNLHYVCQRELGYTAMTREEARHFRKYYCKVEKERGECQTS
ncbi:MAG: helix-turn-helix transcriptional regulator [Synergistaceae bacterium]|nr:helix-turn-helix transcriptional regulator [Synergistaceae bacterium]